MDISSNKSKTKVLHVCLLLLLVLTCSGDEEREKSNENNIDLKNNFHNRTGKRSSGTNASRTQQVERKRIQGNDQKTGTSLNRNRTASYHHFGNTTTTKYTGEKELDLIDFMRPTTSHGIILPFHKNTAAVASSLWSFFEKERQPQKSTSKGEVDVDDKDYLADKEEEISSISPLVNLPIISNLITGKGLGTKQSGSEEDPMNRATLQSHSSVHDENFNGFNVKVNDEHVGSISALPENAIMDLEDPLYDQPEFFIETVAVDGSKKDSLISNNSTAQNTTHKYYHMGTKQLTSRYSNKSSSLHNSTHLDINKTHSVNLKKQSHDNLTHHFKNASSAVYPTTNTTTKIFKHQPNLESSKNTTSLKLLSEKADNFNETLISNFPRKSNKNLTAEQPKANTTAQNHQGRLAVNSTTQTKQKFIHRNITTNYVHNSTQLKASKTDNRTKTSSDKIHLVKPQKIHKNTTKSFPSPIHQQKNSTSRKNITRAHHDTHEISFKNVSSSFNQLEDFKQRWMKETPSNGTTESLHSTNTTTSKKIPNENHSKQPSLKEKVEYEDKKIIFVQISPSEQVHCMDGSSPAYYVRKGYGGGRDKWIVHLHGGAWCYDLRSCSKRRSSILGSTKRSLDEDISGFFHGILSNDHVVNPHFYNWNVAVLTYCDGGLFSGNRDKVLIGNGKRYYFQGRRVLKSQLQSIQQNTNMKQAKDVVLSGTSAGGLSLLLQANYIKRFLPEQAKVRGLVDAGFFLDQNSVWNTSISNIQFKALYSLHRPTLSRACVESQPAGKKYKCLFPVETIKNVKMPLFLVNSLYDHWQLSYLEGITCVYDDSKCDIQQHDRILNFRNSMYKTLKSVTQHKNTTGVFANSCFAHGQVILDYTWSSAKINKKTISEAFYDWYKDEQLSTHDKHVHTDCKLPCNGSCPRSLANRCVVNFMKASPKRRKRNAEIC